MPAAAPPPAALLRDALRRAFPDATVAIEDLTARHRRHAEAAHGGHLRATVTSDAFRGLAPLARHRLVLSRLPPLERLGIHALGLRLRSSLDPTPSPSSEDLP